MRIIRAKSSGMCFGVRDAIALALHQARQAPLTIYGELVHNEAVLNALRQQGIQLQQQVEEVQTENVMITAHGASNRTRFKLRDHGLNVLEATCPLVHHAHRVVQRLVQEKYHPVIIGKRDHVEVRGLTEDLGDFHIVLSEEDVKALPEYPRFGIAAQTTQPIERVQHLVNLIQRRFPRSEVRFEDTVCQPTKQRQLAAVELAQRSDVVIVIGGAHSNNTRQLVETCRRFCDRVHHVQSAEELQPEWLERAETVGITAGTSTPDVMIDRVELRLKSIAGALEVSAHGASLALPKRASPLAPADAPVPLVGTRAAIAA